MIPGALLRLIRLRKHFENRSDARWLVIIIGACDAWTWPTPVGFRLTLRECFEYRMWALWKSSTCAREAAFFSSVLRGLEATGISPAYSCDSWKHTLRQGRSADSCTRWCVARWPRSSAQKKREAKRRTGCGSSRRDIDHEKAPTDTRHSSYVFGILCPCAHSKSPKSSPLKHPLYTCLMTITASCVQPGAHHQKSGLFHT